MAGDAYKDRIRNDYTARTEKFGTAIKTYTDPNLNKLMLSGLELPEDLRGLKALDLSCGQGDSSKHMKESGIKTYWMDITPEMMKKGVEKGNIVPERRIIGDSRKPPFVDESFDVVMQRYAFHDIEDRERFAEDVYRILRNNGRFQITDMCVDDTKIPEDSVRAALNMYNTYHSRKTKGETRPVWIASKGEFYNIFETAGLMPISESWYTSKVSSMQWFRENQIFEDRLKELNTYFAEQSKNPAVKEYFNLRIEEDTVEIDFPVIILTGIKG